MLLGLIYFQPKQLDGTSDEVADGVQAQIVEAWPFQRQEPEEILQKPFSVTQSRRAFRSEKAGIVVREFIQTDFRDLSVYFGQVLDRRENGQRP